MSDELKSTTTPTADVEPTSTLATAPIWLIVLMLLLVFWGALHFDMHGAWFEPQVYRPYASIADVQRFQPMAGSDADRVVARGKSLFEKNCGQCHGNDGLGKTGSSPAPPLAGSEWVNAPGVNRLVRIPRLGLTGPIEVKGQTFNYSMAAMGNTATYSADDLAAVLSYIRQAWGNKASLVTAEQVKAVDTTLGNRMQPNTADELKSLPEK